MNPFIYGEEVRDENFCNRIDEIKELDAEVRNHQNILIHSPRRFGKTSLIKEVCKNLQNEGFIIVYIDLYPMMAEEDFARICLKSISAAVGGSRGNVLDRIKKYFKKISPSFFVTFSEDGTPSVGFNLSRGELLPAVEDLFNGLYTYARAKNKSAVVVFDEFQEVGELEDNRIERVLRGIIQGQREISYVFMGSKKHLIHDMFSNPGRPFYKSTRHFPLKTIGEGEFTGFIAEKFLKTGIRIERSVAAAIVRAADCHPYYTQMLAHVVWELAFEKKNVTGADVETAISKNIEREEAVFNTVWDNLTLKQRRLLAALCFKREGEKLYSVDFLSHHNLGSAGTVQRGVKSLMQKGLIDREGEHITISDIFLKYWLERRIRP